MVEVYTDDDVVLDALGSVRDGGIAASSCE